MSSVPSTEKLHPDTTIVLHDYPRPSLGRLCHWSDTDASKGESNGDLSKAGSNRERMASTAFQVVFDSLFINPNRNLLMKENALGPLMSINDEEEKRSDACNHANPTDDYEKYKPPKQTTSVGSNSGYAIHEWTTNILKCVFEF